jgi:hypothetical protein
VPDDGVRLLCEITIPKRIMLDLKFKAWSELSAGAELTIYNHLAKALFWTSTVRFIKVLHGEERE